MTQTTDIPVAPVNHPGLPLKSQRTLALSIVVLYGFYLLFTSAFYPLDFLSVFDAKRLLQLLLFMAVMIFALAWAPLRKASIEQLDRLTLSNRIILVVFFFIGFVSSLRLDHSAYALADVSMLLVLMILIAVTAASRDLSGPRFDKWAVVLLSITGFAVAIQELTGFVAGWVLGSEFSYDQALVHFAHPRFYNQLQTWSIPILAALPLIFPAKRSVKLICVALLGLQWFLVIGLAARGTVVSLFISMAFIALWLPGQRRFWLRYQLAGLLAGILIYSGMLFMNSHLIPSSQSGEFFAHSVGRPMAHTSGRSMLWRLSIDDARKHPLLGSGPNHYACESEIVLPAHTHSFPFRILGEWGGIALLLVLLFTVTVGVAFLQTLKHGDRTTQKDSPLQAMLATSLIAGALHACLSGLLIMPASQVAFILVAGWNLSLHHQAHAGFRKRTAARLVLLCGLLLTSAMLVFAIREIPQLPTGTTYVESDGELNPRFWWVDKVCDDH